MGTLLPLHLGKLVECLMAPPKYTISHPTRSPPQFSMVQRECLSITPLTLCIFHLERYFSPSRTGKRRRCCFRVFSPGLRTSVALLSPPSQRHPGFVQLSIGPIGCFFLFQSRNLLIAFSLYSSKDEASPLQSETPRSVFPRHVFLFYRRH